MMFGWKAFIFVVLITLGYTYRKVHRAKVSRIMLGSGHSPIYRLPPELFLYIADYLSVDAGASLSLTCYSLYLCLGKQCLPPLKQAEYSIKSRFLYFLERDLPTHIVCPHCNQLHSMLFAKNHHLPFQFRKKKPPLKCWLADEKEFLWSEFWSGFSSTIFRMAMKAHRQGRETTKLLNLLSDKTRTYDYEGFLRLQTTAVQIQGGSLLTRKQTAYMVSSSQKVPLPWMCIATVCCHIGTLTTQTLYQYGIQIPLENEIEGYENKQGLIYCEYCYTEFRIDFKSYGKAGNAMLFTKWVDVGEGRDPNDPKFSSRLWSNSPRYNQVRFRRGSICTAFEGMAESEIKFDLLLTQKDERLLRRGRYQPWPKGKQVSRTGVRQIYTVHDGRFVYC